MNTQTIFTLMTLQANNQPKIDNGTLKKAVMTLRAINHPLRKQMLSMLEETPKLTVTEIFIKLRLEQSVASQHLAILRKAGVLDTERDGKFIYYKLNENRIKEISSIVNDLAQ
jgi:DNA-binding transcriptional ArsR family regulator